MQGFLRTGSLLLSMAAGSVQLLATDFTTADNAFFQRGSATPQDRGAIYAAVREYQKVLNEKPGVPETLYAVEQIARLYALETRLDVATTEVKKAAENCLENVETLNPAKLGEQTPQYFYWTALCRLAWANANGALSSLQYSKEVAKYLDAGLSLEPNYEGGGFDRLAGILYSKLPSWNPLGGPVLDMPRALNHFTTALNYDVAYEAPYAAEWKDLETETGGYFYELYFYYAVALVKDNQKEQAKAVLKKGIERIDAGQVAKARDVESAMARKQMAGYLNSL